jgi:hypothetical protein
MARAIIGIEPKDIARRSRRAFFLYGSQEIVGGLKAARGDLKRAAAGRLAGHSREACWGSRCSDILRLHTPRHRHVGARRDVLTVRPHGHYAKRRGRQRQRDHQKNNHVRLPSVGVAGVGMVVPHNVRIKKKAFMF